MVVLGAAGGAGFWWYHEQPQFCGICHLMDAYVESWQGSDLLAQEHGEEAVACLDCHEATIEEQVRELVVYVSGEFRVPLKERRYPAEECFACHLPNEHTSWQEVIERTRDYVVTGKVINPHDPHAGLEEMSQYECYSCHKMHRDSPGVNFCYTCHHAGLVSCSQCHED